MTVDRESTARAHAGGTRPRVAVIGSGISGLAAAFVLSGCADLTVYEQNSTIGGHTYTVDVEDGMGRVVPVDMGFIVYNEQTYPNLTALFAHLDVATETTDMSLAISLDGGRLEYAGGHPSQLFAQRSNLVRPRFWSMLRDLVRFYRSAPHDLENPTLDGITLGAYLDRNGYGAAFCEDHLLPMAAAIWSIPAADVLDYPARAFIRFQENHGLLKLTNRPLWQIVKGGSRSYAEKLARSFADRIRNSDGVVGITRGTDGVLVRTSSGEAQRFDHVVVATHADQALALIDRPTPAERRLLGAIRYQSNDVVLHSDPRLMPKRRRAWASWNYIGGTGHAEGRHLTVTYWMNRLQGLKTEQPLFVTLNPGSKIEVRNIHQTRRFDHPVLDLGATLAQRQLWTLQGVGGVWYCGAYFGAGFHEDGLQAGLAVGEAISGRKRPWRVDDESGRIFFGTRTMEPPAMMQEGAAA